MSVKTFAFKRKTPQDRLAHRPDCI